MQVWCCKYECILKTGAYLRAAWLRSAFKLTILSGNATSAVRMKLRTSVGSLLILSRIVNTEATNAVTLVLVSIQVGNPAGSSSPEFDAAFANEAEAMFGFGREASGLVSSVNQLQRRLRLSDVGLEHSPAAQMLLEDAAIIKVATGFMTCFMQQLS